MSVTNHTFCEDISSNVSMNYQLYLPHDLGLNRETKYPLILFLHGVKKRGEDISLLNNYGLTWITESQTGFPYIVVTPQCKVDSNWGCQFRGGLNRIKLII